MSYARFGSSSDVYIFMSTQGHLECCGCILGDRWEFDSTQAMVDHIAVHRAVGHTVPDGIEDDLRADDQANWVDYARCQLEGCDERVTCGSPAPGGYVSACSIDHAQQLGGFANWPKAAGR